MSLTDAQAKTAAGQVAHCGLLYLAPKLEALVFARDATISDRVLAGFSAHLQALEQLLITDASVSVTYALNNHPDVRESYERAKHALDVLKRIHGPQGSDEQGRRIV